MEPAFADFAQIHIGDRVTSAKEITADAIDAFAELSGDFNPLHVNDKFAKQTSFRRRVAHGMLSAAYVSALIGMKLPGAGALWMQQKFDFLAPALVGDTIEFTLEVIQKSESMRTIVIAVTAVKQDGKTILTGQGTVMVLEEQTHDGTVVSSSNVLKNQVALVTGASRGIGAAIARELGRAGASVIINYKTNEVAARQVSQETEQAGGKTFTYQADVCDPDAIDRMVQEATAHFGCSVSILVNNASSRINQQAFWDLSWKDIEQHLDVQIRGAFNCCKAVIPQMIDARKGCILNIGSTYSWGVPPEKMAAYVVSKAALAAFTRCLAVELGSKGIRVNTVSPGFTETDLTADIPPRIQKVFAMQNPLRRLGSPEDVARVIVMLCSPAGSYINGADIPVSGGSAM